MRIHGLRVLTSALTVATMAGVGCGSSSGTPAPDAGALGPDASVPTMILMDYGRNPDFWSAPFPSEDLRNADGSIAIQGFPNPTSRGIVQDAINMIAATARGFSTTGGAFFQVNGPLDPTQLPDLAGSLDPASSVALIDVDPQSPALGKFIPVEVTFTPSDFPYGPLNLLSLLPLQGRPLQPHTTYAAVVRSSLVDATGIPLIPSPVMSQLAAGVQPPNMSTAAFTSYQNALQVLGTTIPADDIVAITVFTTDDPTVGLAQFRTDIQSRPHPVIDKPFAQTAEDFPEYCVYETTIPMPDYQAGTPPFASDSDGGGWQVDASGNPIVQRMEDANVVITIPRMPIPAAGFPTMVFVRTGGGGDRPLVDRGKQATNGGPPIVPGSGYAEVFAKSGYAGISIDGPLGGLRNTTGQDEEFTVFNVANPIALRDNIREQAVELMLVPYLLDDFVIDTSDCQGGPTTSTFDTSRIGIMGHSTGAWITPLAVSFEPRFKALVLSGAGGSWIENVLYKEKPLVVLPDIEALLDTDINGGGDAILSLLEWAAEPADPAAYTRFVAPRHVLMEQGIVDHYISPRIANTDSLSMALDLAGMPLDQNVGVPDQVPLESLLVYSGGQQISFPVVGNMGGTRTAIVVQHPSDDIEDGHEMVFQTDPPRQEIRCYLLSWLSGVPAIPMGISEDMPCVPNP